MVEKRKNKFRRFFSGLVSVIMALILIGLIYLAAVLLETPDAEPETAWIVEEEKAEIPYMQAATISDIQALSRHFGAPLPDFSGHSMKGEAWTASHDGQTVRRVAMQYDAFLIEAVRPASAAPMLLREELSVSLRSDLTVMHLPAVLASEKGACCAYFSNEWAAYAIYAPAASEEDFLALLERITTVQ